MIFSTIFRLQFLESLKKNAAILENDSCKLLGECINTPYKKIAFRVMCDPVELALDINRGYSIIRSTLAKETAIDLRLKSGILPGIMDNEIKIDISQTAMGSSRIDRNYHLKLEEKWEDEFWTVPDKLNDFYSLSNFACFDNRLVSRDDFPKYKNRGQMINVTGWVDYLSKLVAVFFPDFQLYPSKSDNRKRYLKSIGGNLMFGFEFDLKKYQFYLRQGDFDFPEFNLILINEKFVPKIKPEDYVFSYNNHILSLGNIGNPFFFPPCLPLDTYFSIEAMADKYEIRNFYRKYDAEYEETPDGLIQIIHSEEFGEKLKRHAFYYMDLLSYSSKGYISYVERCIHDALSAAN